MDDNRAEAWEFLLQCKGDPAWMPLAGDRLALVEGKYRIALHKPDTVGAEVDVRVTFTDLATNPPKCRSEQRHCRTDIHGMAMVIPPTHLKPGRWEIRCYGDLLAELSGSAWRRNICLEVTPSFHLADAAEAEAIVESILVEPEFEAEDIIEVEAIEAREPIALTPADFAPIAGAEDLAFETTAIAFDFETGAALVPDLAVEPIPATGSSEDGDAIAQPEPAQLPMPEIAEPSPADEPERSLSGEKPAARPAIKPAIEIVASAPDIPAAIPDAEQSSSPAEISSPTEINEITAVGKAVRKIDISSGVLRSELLACLDRILIALEAMAERAESHGSSPSLPPIGPALAVGDRTGRDLPAPPPEGARAIAPPEATTKVRTRPPGPQLPPVPSRHTNLRTRVAHLLSDRSPEDPASDASDANPAETLSSVAADRWSNTGDIGDTKIALHSQSEPLAAPYLDVAADPIAGQPTRIRVRLPASSKADIVKLWLLDGNSGLLLDGPQRISRFTPNRQGDREAVTHFKMPFGCLVARLEAIALQDSSDRASAKTAIERCVNLPNVRGIRQGIPLSYLSKMFL